MDTLNDSEVNELLERKYLPGKHILARVRRFFETYVDVHQLFLELNGRLEIILKEQLETGLDYLNLDNETYYLSKIMTPGYTYLGGFRQSIKVDVSRFNGFLGGFSCNDTRVLNPLVSPELTEPNLGSFTLVE